MSGGSEQANGRASGPVLQSVFWVILAHSERLRKGEGEEKKEDGKEDRREKEDDEKRKRKKDGKRKEEERKKKKETNDLEINRLKRCPRRWNIFKLHHDIL